jgi:dipeptidyl aminopeptidase/acylaminoacyl peptidase
MTMFTVLSVFHGQKRTGQLVVADEESELEDNYETASNQYYAKNLVGKLLLIHGEEPQDRQTDRQQGTSAASR